MTIETLVNGIASMLNSEFGDVPVYDERVEQSGCEEGFHIRMYRNKNAKQLAWRYLHQIDVEVRYVPPRIKAPDPRHERHAIGDVSDALNYLFLVLEIDGVKYRTRDLELVPSDGVLVTTFTLDVPEIEERDPDVMKTHHTIFKNPGWRADDG